MSEFVRVEQLLVLANLESMNAEFIRMGLTQADRLVKLNAIAITQLKSITAQTHNNIWKNHIFSKLTW